MKLRLSKLLLLKPKSAIGVSMLDVISNALASVILLFFVLVALRAIPPPPERILGVLVVDYEITWKTPDERSPVIEVFLRKPNEGQGEYPPSFGQAIESTFLTGPIDTIAAVWPSAVVLQDSGVGYLRKRVFYMNPECPGDPEQKCEWEAGVIYVDDRNFLKESFPRADSATLSLKAWFVQGPNSPVLTDTVLYQRKVMYPTEIVRKRFEIPRFQRL